MAKFRCDRYPNLRIPEFGDLKFADHELVTTDAKVTAALSSDRYPDVERVADDESDGGESEEAAGDTRYAYPRSRGWYDVDGLDRNVRREDIPDGVVVLDEDGNVDDSEV